MVGDQRARLRRKQAEGRMTDNTEAENPPVDAAALQAEVREKYGDVAFDPYGD